MSCRQTSLEEAFAAKKIESAKSSDDCDLRLESLDQCGSDSDPDFDKCDVDQPQRPLDPLELAGGVSSHEAGPIEPPGTEHVSSQTGDEQRVGTSGKTFSTTFRSLPQKAIWPKETGISLFSTKLV